MANGVLGSVVEDEIAKVRVGIQATKISVAKIHQQLVCALLITGVLAVIGFPDRVGKRIIRVAPGSTCSISNSGRGPRAMIGFAQSSIGSPSSPQ